MTAYEAQTRQWLNAVVVGLNLCPFAHKPLREDSVRFYTCESGEEAIMFECIDAELDYLHCHEKMETSLIIFPKGLEDFYGYCDFLRRAEKRLVNKHYEGVFQLAGFHPHYLFANESSDDASHFTNRSPYPLVHILREESVASALEKHPDADAIPAQNIHRLRSLKSKELCTLFPYANKALFKP